MDAQTDIQQMMGTFEYFLEILATLFYAISGVRLAAVKKFDWFGAYTIGFVTAIGGGTIRDVFLKCNPFWMLDPWYAIATIVGLVMVIVLKKYLVRIEGTFYIFDAIGLGLFVDVAACCATSLSTRSLLCSARRYMPQRASRGAWSTGGA